MQLLKALAMPFQLASLLFVAASSLLLGLLVAMSSHSVTNLLLGVFAIWMMLVWLTNYALHLIDDAANGVREARAASIEMMQNPFLDTRSWIHPLLAAALGVLYYFHPLWPVWPALLIAALLFPASIGACAISGHALDAFNPASMWRVVAGLGPWYPLLVLFVGICALAGVLLTDHLQAGVVLIGSEELLLLLVYAAIGGVLFQRRLELGFEPRHSPERKAEIADAERNTRRQQWIDGLYKDLQVHEVARAVASARQWFATADRAAQAGDLQALFAAGRSWTEARDYPRLLQGMIPVLLELKLPALAFSVAETALAAVPTFAPAEEASAATLVDYALATGRRRAAAQLLDNYLQRDAGLQRDAARAPGPALAALRDRLRPPGA